VRKKAALCLLKLFRTNPDNITHPEWAPQMARLLEERHLGVLLSAMSLLLALAAKAPGDYEVCVPYVVALLSRLVLTPRAVMDDYLYYATPSPWLQVRECKGGGGAAFD
jgi:AP-2 complex subunit alpha